jgi:hypothetical protein
LQYLGGLVIGKKAEGNVYLVAEDDLEDHMDKNETLRVAKGEPGVAHVTCELLAWDQLFR